jgi:hypothetical protein
MTTCVPLRVLPPTRPTTVVRRGGKKTSAAWCRQAPYPRPRRVAFSHPHRAAAGDDAPTSAPTATAAPAIVAATAVEDEEDDDAPPPISAAAAKANASVDSFVTKASVDSVALAAASAPNTYLPLSPGFSLPLPPEPVRFPRAPVNIKLAVLLLRSTYETMDAMVRGGGPRGDDRD